MQFMCSCLCSVFCGISPSLATFKRICHICLAGNVAVKKKKKSKKDRSPCLRLPCKTHHIVNVYICVAVCIGLHADIVNVSK
uniref:Secreted protein n=1 Tax=Rhipicephalus zambeziensis TaxID=60191 RepID=A0A224YHH3_9ACAR